MMVRKNEGWVERKGWFGFGASLTFPALLAAVMALTALMGAGCASVPPEGGQQQGASAEESGTAGPESGTDEERAGGAPAGKGLSPEEEAAIQDAADAAAQSIRYGDYSAGIETYVNILGRTRPGGESPSPFWEDQVKKELESIGSRLSMLAADNWQNSSGDQIEASVTALAEGKAPMPSVILTAEGGKFAVRDVPVAFEFVHGNGTLTPFVMTDEGGRAKSSVSRVEDPREEVVVRAVLEFRGKTGRYRFDQVFRDFTYLPPSQNGLIAGAVELEGAVRPDPRVTNAVRGGLELDGWEFSVREELTSSGNGTDLSEDRFRRAFSGEPEALGRLAGESRASYLVMVITTIPEVRQVSYGGEDFELYTAAFRSSLRIIRTADGSVLYSDDLPETSRGQGGTRRAAADDAVGKAAAGWKERLAQTSGAMKEALTGEEKEGGSGE